MNPPVLVGLARGGLSIRGVRFLLDFARVQETWNRTRFIYLLRITRDLERSAMRKSALFEQIRTRNLELGQSKRRQIWREMNRPS